jgi:hypothetical protein
LTTSPHAVLAAVGAIEPTTLEQNETWTLTKLSTGRQPIQNRCVFKLKLDGDGAVRRYKAQLVSKGFRERNIRERKITHPSQENHIARLLEKFNFSDCQARIAPADSFTRPYREAVGALMYAVTCTRLDTAWADSQVVKFCPRPTRANWEALKRTFAYLKRTQAHGVTYGNSSAGEGVLQTYNDAVFAANVDVRRSTTGVVLLDGDPISWRSRRQSCASLPTTESEYVTAAAAAKEVVGMRRLFQDLGCNQLKPTFYFVTIKVLLILFIILIFTNAPNILM